MRKARLALKGYQQKYGINYHEEFAEVSRMDSVRCIIASAGWKLNQFDAVAAFLHGDVDSFVYKEWPEGIEEAGFVCRLRRSLYGLKTGSRISYQCVHRVLAARGFNMVPIGQLRVLKIQICDLYLRRWLSRFYSNSHEIDPVQRALETEFRLNDLGIPSQL
jgi:hypothetical protein